MELYYNMTNCSIMLLLVWSPLIFGSDVGIPRYGGHTVMNLRRESDSLQTLHLKKLVTSSYTSHDLYRSSLKSASTVIK
jgi:hypothetical protein